MANQEEHAGLDGLKSPTTNEIGSKPIANTNGVSYMENVITAAEPSAAKEAKKVTITEPTSGAAGDILDRTITKSEAQVDAVEHDDELENGNTPMEMGVGKKKKKKSKPKSKRGLVMSQIQSSMSILTTL